MGSISRARSSTGRREGAGWARAARRGAVTAAVAFALTGSAGAAWADQGSPATATLGLPGALGMLGSGIAAVVGTLNGVGPSPGAQAPAAGVAAPGSPRVAALPVRAMAAAAPAAGAPAAVSAQGACATTATQVLDPFRTHLTFAHLERSLGGQVEDIENVDQYVKTHTVLVSTMVAPIEAAVGGILGGTLDPFFIHLKFAHLERSPMGQVEDIKNADQYVKTHTVLIATMLAPAAEALGGCGAAPQTPPMPMPMP
jgi:hypothetical protein